MRGSRGRKILILALVASLHLLLALLLVVALRPPAAVPRKAATAQIAIPTQPEQPQPPPPMPRLEVPQPAVSTAPQIAIALPLSPPVAATPQGALALSSGGGTGSGNGAGGSGQQAAPPASAAVTAMDPDCETVDAYTARIHAAINRFSQYPAQARDGRLQGAVTMRFFSDPHGRIIDKAIASSVVERVYRGMEQNGRYHDLIVGFTRTGADSWTWQTRVQSDTGARTVLGGGTIRAGEDGVLRSPERADGMMVVAIPDAIPSYVARVSRRFGTVADLVMLEKTVDRALRLAQSLPPIPACLKLKMLDATMPFRFYRQRR